MKSLTSSRRRIGLGWRAFQDNEPLFPPIDYRRISDSNIKEDQNYSLESEKPQNSSKERKS